LATGWKDSALDKVVELRKDKEDILPRDEAVREETREQTSAAPLSRKAGLGGRRLRALLAFVVLAAVVMLGWPWLAERWSHVSINDARIAANLVAVSSEVSGRVSSISVIAGDQVEKGQLLARIDEEQTLLELQALDAQVTGIEAQQEQLRSQQAMIRTQVAAKLAAGRTEIKAAEANHRASEATLRNARSRFERVSSLARSNVSSAQSLEEAQAALTTAEQQEQATAAGIETALANLDVIRSEEAQIAVLDRQITTLAAQKASLAAERAQKRVDLSRREIRAAFDGVVDSTFIDAGEFVSPGTRLLIYHDPSTVWVDANVKETDFGRVKIGAPVAISVDAFPSIEFRGEVVRLGGGDQPVRPPAQPESERQFHQDHTTAADPSRGGAA
jgi:membrane fusion protein (multidrug efflux system)